MHRLLLITTSRADYSIYRPLIKTIKNSNLIDLRILASGTHISEYHANSYKLIEEDNFKIDFAIDIEVDKNSTNNRQTKIMALALEKLGDLLLKVKFDAAIVLGDRYEMIAFALAAVQRNLPLIHLHGGEISLGSIDDTYRHSLTKLSNMHFCTTEKSRRRIIQMGENPKSVFNFGSLAVEDIAKKDRNEDLDLTSMFGLPDNKKLALLTFHSESRDLSGLEKNFKKLLDEIEKTEFFYIFTASNTDEGGSLINEMKKTYCKKNKDKANFIHNLGPERYYQVLGNIHFMIGNSSSGIIEAASFGIPVINIGDRQKGREQSKNVINCSLDSNEICTAINELRNQGRLNSLRKAKNVYFREGTSKNILNKLEETNFSSLKTKKFFEISA